LILKITAICLTGGKTSKKASAQFSNAAIKLHYFAGF